MGFVIHGLMEQRGEVVHIAIYSINCEVGKSSVNVCILEMLSSHWGFQE